jgi:hypothetical protein
MKRKLLFLLLILIIPYFLGIYPISIDCKGIYKRMPKEVHNAGDTIKPLSKLDITTGQWKAYVIISRDDKGTIKELPKWNVFKTDNKNILQQLQQQKFISSGGDIATATSSIRIYKDGELMFESGLSLDEAQGLQSSHYGWLRATPKNSLLAVIKQFDKVYWPVVIL